VLEKIARSINSGIDALGRSLPGLLVALLKLNAVLVFLWYLVEFAWETWNVSWIPFTLIILTSLLFLGFAIAIFIQSCLEEWNEPPRTLRGTSGRLFVVLVLTPILAVSLIRLLSGEHHNFSSKLLGDTEKQIERLYAYFQ